MENRSVTAAKATGDSKGDPASTSEHAANGSKRFRAVGETTGQKSRNPCSLDDVLPGRPLIAGTLNLIEAGRMVTDKDTRAKVPRRCDTRRARPLEI